MAGFAFGLPALRIAGTGRWAFTPALHGGKTYWVECTLRVRQKKKGQFSSKEELRSIRPEQIAPERIAGDSQLSIECRKREGAPLR